VNQGDVEVKREIVFISKATPGDDEFVLWLAPRLEAAGYTVFADILNLEPGDRWRKQVTGALQDRAIKMLLCCRDSTLIKDGVQEEIGIALDLSKELGDPRFIIPLRIESFKKLFGIGELQYVNFVGSWANGLQNLLDTLARQNVPRNVSKVVINPNWEAYRKRFAIKIEDSPEVLTSNWLRIASVPDVIRYYQPTGALDLAAMQSACEVCDYPAEVYLRGFFSFANVDDISRDFESAGRFYVHSEYPFMAFLEKGSNSPEIKPRQAKNFVSSMFRKSWEKFCRDKGLREYLYSRQFGFHVCEQQSPLGKRIPWGRQSERRSSMLRNAALGKVWEYGVSAVPQFWPYPHFRIKSHVLFAELTNKKAGSVFDSDEQFRLRRKVCKGWRNKQWHGRLMAFLELLSDGASFIELKLSPTNAMRLDSRPTLLTIPVTTVRPDVMPDDYEEQDASTLGNLNVEEDE
jgi:hypothetical protein